MWLHNRRNVFEAVLFQEDYFPTGLPIPTIAAPGTAEKVHVLRQRLEDGDELWNPDDAQMDYGK